MTDGPRTKKSIMSRAADSITLEAVVRERIDRWQDGQRPDVAAVLADHPEVRGHKSLLMDLVLAEYALRTAAGDAVSHSDFCDRFPSYRQSIARLLNVQDYLDRCPDFAADDREARWPVSGEEFLGFELVEPLGRGGLARVYLARECDVGRRFVVVKISRHGSGEANALGKVSHSGVMPIHSVKQAEGGEWTLICMPLVGVATGVDLLDAAFAPGAQRNGQLVRRVAEQTKPLTELPASAMQQADKKASDQRPGDETTWNLTYAEAIARLGLQLAEGLAAAHAAGIMHRDIKPSNVLLAWSGRAMLLDFNLATDSNAASGGLGGTLAYMAPERIASLAGGKPEEARRFDPRCDVYSLGAVLYELLIGRLPAQPADADHLPALAYQPWLDCKRLATKAPSVAAGDSSLSAIVLKCLQFDPAGRYASAEEVASDLRAIVERAELPSKRARQSRRAVVAAIAASVGLGAIGGGLWAYIAKGPASAELLYQQALEEYDRGQYDKAVATFSKCLERRSGWPDALFGRGQAQRKLSKWTEARSDFIALKDANAAWSYALAGFCNMRAEDEVAASIDFMDARNAGLQDAGSLLNYARVLTNRQRYRDAINVYTELLSRDAANVLARRNRALTYVACVQNDKIGTLGDQALVDAREYCRRAPDSIEAACCAAIVYGEAARKDKTFEPAAVAHLKDALKKGMPLDVVNSYSLQLRRLVEKLDDETRTSARRDASFRIHFAPAQEPLETANWKAFLNGHGQPKLLARGK
jgi:eukaryotic-like serine/threonine-protein kinase